MGKHHLYRRNENHLSPDRRHDLSPPGGGQRGEQPLVLTEHQHVSEAGVGQRRAGSADAEQVVAEDRGSSGRHRGSLRKRLICATKTENVRLIYQLGLEIQVIH